MRSEEKIREVEQFLDELKCIIPRNLKEYTYFKTKAMCERYVEKIIESLVDLGRLIIKEYSLRRAEDGGDVFCILAEANIISVALAHRLKNAKGMRNMIAHQYGNVDDAEVFKSITQELPRDAKAFIAVIKRHVNT